MCDIKDQHVKDWELKEAGLKVKKANLIEHFFYKLLRNRLQPFGKCGEGKGPKSHSYHLESVEGVTFSHPVIGNLSLSSVRPHPPTLLSSSVDVDGRARSNGNVQLSIRQADNPPPDDRGERNQHDEPEVQAYPTEAREEQQEEQ